ncbi:MAG: sensor histidine kinase, partial [Erythrobacter sp.]|nr:sensor histidine kinase [Erythrobacter sp.]
MPKSDVSVPFRTVLFSMVVLWATYFVIITVRSYVAGFEMQLELAWRRAIVTGCGLALTTVLWFLLRLFDDRALWIKISAAIVLGMPVALAIGQVNQLVFEDMQQRAEQAYVEKNNLNLRRDEAGNLLVDVPARQGAGVTSESILIAPAQTSADRWRSVIDIA